MVEKWVSVIGSVISAVIQVTVILENQPEFSLARSSSRPKRWLLECKSCDLANSELLSQLVVSIVRLVVVALKALLAYFTILPFIFTVKAQADLLTQTILINNSVIISDYFH